MSAERGHFALILALVVALAPAGRVGAPRAAAAEQAV